MKAFLKTVWMAMVRLGLALAALAGIIWGAAAGDLTPDPASRIPVSRAVKGRTEPAVGSKCLTGYSPAPIFAHYAITNDVPVPTEGVYHIAAIWSERIVPVPDTNAPIFNLKWDVVRSTATNLFVRIDKSSDLVHWIPEAWVWPQDVGYYVDVNATPRQFFRAVFDATNGSGEPFPYFPGILPLQVQAFNSGAVAIKLQIRDP